VSFLLLLLIIQVFSPGWGLVCPEGYADVAQGCLWEYRMLLSSLVVRIFPSHLGTVVWWQCRSPPGFSILRDVGMLRVGWGCGGVKVLPLLSGFSCNVYIQHLSMILL
jgi:hypothetical protein